MSGPRHHFVKLTLGGTLLISSWLVALAQTPSYTTRQPGVSQPAAPPGSGKPSISILGIPTTIRAPVAKPYCNCATQLLGGQPMKSGDALFGPEPDRYP
jgi:hypothetical protein